MTIKITALLLSACAAVLCVFSAIHPNDPFFFVISSNAGVVIARLLIVAALVFMALQKRFVYRGARYACGIFGALLITFGIAGILIVPLEYAAFNVLKPLDFIFALNMGVMFEVIVLSYERGTRRLPRLSRPRNPQLRLLTRRAAAQKA